MIDFTRTVPAFIFAIVFLILFAIPMKLALANSNYSTSLSHLFANNTFCDSSGMTSVIPIPLDSVREEDCDPFERTPGGFTKHCQVKEHVYAKLSITICQPTLLITHIYNNLASHVDAFNEKYLLTLEVFDYSDPQRHIKVDIEYLDVLTTYHAPGIAYRIKPEVLRVLFNGFISPLYDNFVDINHFAMEQLHKHQLTTDEELWFRAAYYTLTTHYCLPLLFSKYSGSYDHHPAFQCQQRELQTLLKGGAKNNFQLRRRIIFDNAIARIRHYNFGIWLERSINVFHDARDLTLGFLQWVLIKVF